MHLKILLPFQVFADVEGVRRIVAQTAKGSFGILPHRLDCVAALAPAIFLYETQTGVEVAVALDEGVLVKTGAEVMVAVRNAVGGAELGQLRKAVEQQMLNLDERQQAIRTALARLESAVVRRFVNLKRHE